MLVVVEDDPDMQLLVRMSFTGYAEFELDGLASDAATAVEMVRAHPPDLIVLDHLLEGEKTGLEVAPELKALAPACQIILFSASEELRERAMDSPAIDAFLLKTRIERLVPLARQLLGLA